MDRQIQDQIWSDLSENSRKKVMARYNEAESYGDTKEMEYYFDVFGEHNIKQAQSAIRTWD